MTTDTVTDWRDDLRAVDACGEAVAFAHGFDSFQAAWDACERGDWMLWWIGTTLTGGPMHPERRPLVRVACQCARLALPHVAAGETRPLTAIELAERWANGDETVTLKQLRTAAAAASVAAAAYAAYAAASASASAAAASDAASDAAYASASDAAYASAAVAVAAYAAAAAAAAARLRVWKQCAEFVRAEYPQPPIYLVKR